MRQFKKIVTLLLVVVMAVSMVGCGEIAMEKIQGNWTTKSINGKALKDYAAEQGVQEASLATNIEIKDDGTFIAKSALVPAGQEYVYERKSNGFEAKEKGKEEIAFSVTYDENNQTLSYSVKDAKGNEFKFELAKGTTDLTLQKPAKDDSEVTEGEDEEPAAEGGAEEGTGEEASEGSQEGGEEQTEEGTENGVEEDGAEEDGAEEDGE